MEEKKDKYEQGRKYTDNFIKKGFVRKSTFIETNKNIENDDDDKELRQSINLNKITIRSDNRIINISEMIPKLLEQIKSKNSSNHNIDNLNHSFGHDSNSSEINDESDDNYVNKKSNNNSPKKIPKLSIRNGEINEYKNLEVPIIYRPKRKTEKSPNIRPRKYSKENKDTLVLKLHKYFFQDGELENIDTLIKYNTHKIIINNNNEENSNQNLFINNELDYIGIKESVINLMNKFAIAFDNENRNQLIMALKGLNEFSNKYKFDYITNLTLEWINKLNEKYYKKCEFKYIGYYNQIRDIMDKMLKQIKKKVDYIIMSQLKKNKEMKNENNINNNNNINNENNINNNNNSNIIKEPPTMIINKSFQKKMSLNKDDLLKTKEIVPIKIDIEVQNSLNIKEVEDILKNLEEGDLGNIGSKGNITNNKKVLNKQNNRNDNELEAFSYPFKDDSMCIIF